MMNKKLIRQWQVKKLHEVNAAEFKEIDNRVRSPEFTNTLIKFMESRKKSSHKLWCNINTTTEFIFNYYSDTSLWRTKSTDTSQIRMNQEIHLLLNFNIKHQELLPVRLFIFAIAEISRAISLINNFSNIITLLLIGRRGSTIIFCVLKSVLRQYDLLLNSGAKQRRIGHTSYQ